MKVENTKLKEVKVIEYEQKYDNRGCSYSIYTKNVMRFDEPFDPRYSRQIAYNDPKIGIEYPISNPILAPHDINAPFLEDSDLNL